MVVWQNFCQTTYFWSVCMAVMELLGMVFGIVFPFWPVVVLAPLGWRRGKVFRAMQASWLMMFVGWILIHLVEPVPSLLIPEPWNTILFFTAGLLIFGWAFLKKYREKSFLHKTADKTRTPQDLLDISPAQFEKMVLELYSLHGYTATRTGKTGDHGVDVVVQTPKGEKWIVQCKRWRGAIGEPVIRDFFGAMYHEKADRGVLITTGTFTPRGSEWAQGKPLILVDGNQFLSTWKKEKGFQT
jgi:HJR/Mrr/RecB family endonuclease